MSHFLLAWELGGALGHLAALRALATPLIDRGHRVTLALGDLQRSKEIFPENEVIQAPMLERQQTGIIQPSTFADILSNAGWEDSERLARLATEWRRIIGQTRPDVVVGNYAPTALLASQGLDVRSVVFGTGFYSPPDISPVPDLCRWRDNYPDRLQITERRVLEKINRQLLAQNARPLERITQLYQRADARLMTTYPEMDHYPERSDGEYIGPWGELPGTEPCWPTGLGPRVFAYLKPMEALDYLLHHLRDSG